VLTTTTTPCPAGDLLTALLLARLDEAPDDLKTAVELAIGSLQGIVLKTYEASLTHLGPKESTPQVWHHFLDSVVAVGGRGGGGGGGGSLRTIGVLTNCELYVYCTCLQRVGDNPVPARSMRSSKALHASPKTCCCGGRCLSDFCVTR